MIFPRLFVSDLDGTLLRDNSQLSDFAYQKLTRLLSEGVPFTIATARSITSIKQVLPVELPISLPVICSNGAYLANYQTSERTHVNSIPKPLDKTLLEDLLQSGFHPFVGSWNGDQDFLRMGEIPNQGTAWYRDDRVAAGDPRLETGVDVRMSLDHQIISINVIDTQKSIFELADRLNAQYGRDLQIYTYQNWHGLNWYWLSCYSIRATKGKALSQLCQEIGVYSEDCMVFGDNLNDISMFEWAGQGVAVANAHSALFPLAQHVIDTNETDSVVKHIAKLTTEPNFGLDLS